MKRNIFFAAVLCLSAALTSCLRGDEMEMLKHPINIQGELTPTYGVPAAYGSVDVNDLLGMLSASYTGYLDPDSSTLTIVFDTTGYESLGSLTGGSSTAHRPSSCVLPKSRPGTKASLLRIDTVFSYDLPITLFDDAIFDDINDNIQIKQLLLSLDLTLHAHAPSAHVRDSLFGRSYAKLDNLSITYYDHDNHPHKFQNDQIDSLSASISELLEPKGKTFNIDTINMASIINDMPRLFSISYHLAFELDETFLNSDFIDILDLDNSFSAMLDSINLTSLDLDYGIHARFPFRLSIQSLPYEFSLDMGEREISLNIDSILATIDSGIYVIDSALTASFVLEFNNGIPLNLNMQAKLRDKDSLIIGTGADTIYIDGEIAKAQTDRATLKTTAPVKSTITKELDRKKLDEFADARYVNLRLELGTNREMVQITKDDKLDIRAYIILHPAVGIDIPIVTKPILK